MTKFSVAESAVAVREAMSEVYVHQDEQETTKKAPYLPPARPTPTPSRIRCVASTERSDVDRSCILSYMI